MGNQKPLYHFRPPANWMNDPNGLIQWNGQYHLFYQYNPAGPFHGTIHWGHAVTTDLVHWTHLPLALAPTPGGPDADGCWSGCAVDHNGTPTLMYTGITNRSDGSGIRETQCLATGTDDLLTWTASPSNPVIPGPPPGLEVVGFRDPFVWKENDGWACVIGSGIVGVGGTILFYRSRDLVEWTYQGPLWIGDVHSITHIWTGSMWECPQFFPLGDQHVLIFSVWDAGKTHYTAYAVGTYDGARFTPMVIRRFDLGPDYYAPATMRDERGRQLVWGWVREARRKAAQHEDGWSGVMSAPRVLTLGDDDRLNVAPVPELQALRRKHYRWTSLDLFPDMMSIPLDVQGECLEISVTFDPRAAVDAEFGLRVRCSPDEREYTSILYSTADQSLVIDREKASLAPTSYRGCYKGASGLPSEETVTMHLFLDRSIIEVYLNDLACFTVRIYPTLPNSLGLALVGPQGRVHVRTVDIWELDTPVAE